MYNYARNYRNWSPQRRPYTRYQDTYFPIENSREYDGHHANSNYYEGEDSSSESKPFENEVREIDYYAQQNRNYERYDISKSDIRNQGRQHGDYQPDIPAAWSHEQGYSTLPDEFITTHSSPGSHDFSSGAGQDFRLLKNQNHRDSQDFRLFNNQNPKDSQEFTFKDQNFGEEQEFRFKNQNPVDRHKFRLMNQNFGGGQEFRFKNNNSGNGQESRYNVQNYPIVQNTQFNSYNSGSGLTSDGKKKTRHNVQNFVGRHELQYNTHIQNSGQESRLNDQNFGGVQDLRYNKQNSAGRYSNQNSGGGVQDNESSFSTSRGNTNINRPHSETEQSIGGVGNSHPSTDDLYYKAFRSFSFRRNPTQSGSKAGHLDSFSGGGFSGKVVPQSSSPSHQSGFAHSDRQNKWFNDGTGPSKDHDIGFFEGLEDINDKVGI
jgi:hypothetical protein